VSGRLARTLLLATFLAAAGAAHGVELRVGPSAGAPGSNCQFARIQDAIDALPNDDELHRIQVELANYVGADGALSVRQRRVHVTTHWARDSGCSQPLSDVRASLFGGTTSAPGVRIVEVRAGGELTLERFAIGFNQEGALLVRDGRLFLRHVDVSNNVTPAGLSGAGAVVEGGLLSLHESRFLHNEASANGGAMFCAGGQVVARGRIEIGEGVLISENRAGLHGGGLYMFGACDVEVLGSARFDRNESTLDGGALAVEARTSDDASASRLVLSRGELRFEDNRAIRDGGAIHWGAGNDLVLPDDTSRTTSLLFLENRAGDLGGALALAGTGSPIRLPAATFLRNQAGALGGAVAVSGRHFEMHAVCDSRVIAIADRYCAGFRDNALAGSFDSGLGERGGTALYVDSGGSISLDRVAILGSPFEGLIGSVRALAVFVRDGDLVLRNVLIADALGSGLTTDQAAIDLRAGASAVVANSTIAGNRAAAIRFADGAALHIVGSIVAENSFGLVGNGELRGTCNNAQLGFEPPPQDPGFLSTARGRFRLRPDSPMIGRGSGCAASRLPPGYLAPVLDLDGNPRAVGEVDGMAFDLGAFEAGADLFKDGFER
jgi:hypothetical protein